MKATCAIVITLFMAGAAPLRAEEQSTSQYLQQLQRKLDHAAQRANQPTSAGSNVVGLRGSKAEPLSKQLYWKGKEKSVPVSLDEIRSFRSAVEQARAGQNAEAISTLKQFQEKYPKSALHPDVEETMKRLSDAATPTAS